MVALQEFVDLLTESLASAMWDAVCGDVDGLGVLLQVDGVLKYGRTTEGRINGKSLKSPSSIAVPSAKSTAVMPCPCVFPRGVSVDGLGLVLGVTEVWKVGAASSTITELSVWCIVHGA